MSRPSPTRTAVPAPAARDRVPGRPEAPDATTSLAIDPIACDAFGYCAELLPELVGLDEWGYPIVGDRRVPEALVARATAAARQCPRRAVTLRREAG